LDVREGYTSRPGDGARVLTLKFEVLRVALPIKYISFYLIRVYNCIYPHHTALDVSPRWQLILREENKVSEQKFSDMTLRLRLQSSVMSLDNGLENIIKGVPVQTENRSRNGGDRHLGRKWTKRHCVKYGA